MTWIFVWLLVSGGSQYSPGFFSREACESYRQTVEHTRIEPEHGQNIEKTYPCVRVR